MIVVTVLTVVSESEVVVVTVVTIVTVVTVVTVVRVVTEATVVTVVTKICFAPHQNIFSPKQKNTKKDLTIKLFSQFFLSFTKNFCLLRRTFICQKNIVKLQISPKNFFLPIFVHYKKCYNFFLSPKHFFTQN